MNAGRELDCLIADKIMNEDMEYHHENALSEVPCYSTLIQDSKLVLEKFIGEGWSYMVLKHHDGDCLCELWRGLDRILVNHQKTIELAICLAARKAVKETT